MLDSGKGLDLARFAIAKPREDVDLPHHIAMRAETTPTAGIVLAAWFVPLGAVGTGLGRIVCVNQFYCYALSVRLVGDILADLAVVPLRGLLVMLL
jgi:hypothetical protein